MTLFARLASFLNPLAAGAVRRLALLAALASFASLLAAGPAAAASEPAPWWHLTQRVIPSRIEPEGEGKIVVQAINLGNAATAGKYEISDQLPAGLELTGAEFFARPSEEMEKVAEISDNNRPDLGPGGGFSFFEYCQQSANSLSCSNQSGNPEFGPPFCEFLKEIEYDVAPNCTELQPVVPYDFIEMVLKVKAEAGFGPGLLHENRLDASGGEAASAHLERPVAIGDPASVPFGLETFSLRPEEEGGKTATHAGSHPYQLTADVAFNRNDAQNPIDSPALPRNLHFNLPPGQLGNALVTPKCSATDFAHVKEGGGVNQCPSDTVLGAAIVTVGLAPNSGEIPFTVPVFNLEPAPGEPARFGLEVLRNPAIIDTHLRSGPGGDYGVTADISNITELSNVISATTVFWGAPEDPSHNESRGWGCIRNGFYSAGSGLPCEPSNNPKPAAFLTLPTDCAHPFNPLFEGVSWPTKAAPAGFLAEPLEYRLADEAGNPLSLTACNQLAFAPRIESKASADSGETGSGLDFNVDFDDEGLLNAEGQAQSDTEKSVVTLPEGLTINPSVGEGLGVCTPAQYEGETLESAPGEGCPNQSKLGTLEVTSPLVEEAIHGSVFLAQQDDKATPQHGAENPFDSLIALYLVLKNPKLGVIVKLPLKVEPDPTTGQLVATLENIPQLPLSHFNFHFREGTRAPLITPAACGTYTTEAKFYPWANPSTPAEVSASFEVTRGVGGGPCPKGGVPPFHPHFEAGALNNNAGSFSPFNMRLIRGDGEQDMTKFSSILPPGELGSLAGVGKCPDSAIAIAKSKTGRQEIASPSCPSNSLIGHTLAGAGVGEALTYVPGQIYLGGPYHGDPLSVIAVTPAVAGPFDAGTVVVRLALTLNPKTAEVEVDGANSDPIPHILDGIVLKLRDLRVYVDRKNFTLNPTSCEESSAKAILFGSNLDVFNPADDDPVNLSSRYQASNCASLGFKPKLALNLKGGTKRGGHPGLLANYTPRKGDANVKGLVVRLPRSAFLDQAHIRTICTRVQFAAKACPAGAQYGFIKAWTPLLDEPLEGPVYLRSSNHKLPDLVFDLHGLVDVEVDTRIDSVHGGIRASIESAPDAPLSKVVLRMQGGKKGLIVNSRNLCGSTNRADVEFEGQNGKLSSAKPVMKADCGGGRKHKGHRG